MVIKKPYRYIYRRNLNGSNTDRYEYVRDEQYASNRLNLSRAYTNIERKLREILDYIEPSDNNKDVYSIELYSLLLRSCTEVEMNLKQILKANILKANNVNLNLKDNDYSMNYYVAVEQSSKLSHYKLKYLNWRFDEKEVEGNNKRNIVRYEDKILCPFEQFGIYDKSKINKNISTNPKWYSAYNAVKHNREENFRLATLDNCMNAVAGILVLLYSQFGPYCIDTYGINKIPTSDSKNDCEPEFDADVIFEFLEWPEWTDDEKYDFYWDELKKDPNPFDKFQFHIKGGQHS